MLQAKGFAVAQKGLLEAAFAVRGRAATLDRLRPVRRLGCIGENTRHGCEVWAQRVSRNGILSRQPGGVVSETVLFGRGCPRMITDVRG